MLPALVPAGSWSPDCGCRSAARWYRAWSAFGLRLVEQADAALAAGHRVSARDAYLRATEYLRQAFFFHRENLDGDETRLAYAASVAAFRRPCRC